MTKNNTNEHTQIELFDESHNIFEVIDQAAADKAMERKQKEQEVFKRLYPNIIICKVKR